MDIRELRKIDIKDLKNIDVNQLAGVIRSKPEILIKIMLILCTIFGTIYLINNGAKNAKTHSMEVSKLKDKLSALEKKEKNQKLLDQFVSDFPSELSSNGLVNQIALFASNNDIEVVSFSPANKVEYGYMALTTVEITITTDDYRNISAYAKSIETSKFAIRIEKLIASNSSDQSTGRSNTRLSGNEQQSKEKVGAKITISAIELNKKIK